MDERKLRRREYLTGVPLELADGQRWTIPARPLVGQVALAILARLQAVDEVLLRALHMGRQMSAATLRVQAAMQRAGETLRAEPALEPSAELAKLDGALERGDLEIKRIQQDLACLGAERAEHLGALLLAAMQINYPAITLEEVGELVSVTHLDDVLAIVKGEKQLRELHGVPPAGKTEPAAPVPS